MSATSAARFCRTCGFVVRDAMIGVTASADALAEPIEVVLFHRLEDMVRELGVTTEQIRTACNVLDKLERIDSEAAAHVADL